MAHAADSRPGQHTLLPRGVVLQFLDRQADALAPAVEHERIAVDDAELVTQDPLLAADDAVDLLQRIVKVVTADSLQVIEHVIGRFQHWERVDEPEELDFEIRILHGPVHQRSCQGRHSPAAGLPVVGVSGIPDRP